MSKFRVEVKSRLIWLGRTKNEMNEASPYSQQWFDHKLNKPMSLTIADCDFLAKFLEVEFEKIIEWIYSE